MQNAAAPLPRQPKTGLVFSPIRDEFFERYEPDLNGGCWLWTGYCSHGYGIIWKKHEGRTHPYGAHRAFYERFVGEVPPGLYVLHRCDVPCCVNPAHLFVGTHRENMEDMARKGRHADCRGERQPNAKLTTADVIAIRADRRGVVEIARAYGVRDSTISNIIAGKRWAHIPMGPRPSRPILRRRGADGRFVVAE